MELRIRKSNFELLRIIAFLLVVVVHTTGASLVTPNGLISGSFSWWYANIIRSFASGAVIVFIMLSGYFMISRKNFSYKSTSYKLFIPFLFYVAFLLSYSLSANKTTLLQEIWYLFTCQGNYYHLWYMWVYFIIVYLSPFLNLMLLKLDRRNFIILLAILYFTQSFLPTINALTGNKVTFAHLVASRFMLLVTLYAQAAYFKLFNVRKNIHWLIAIIILSTISIALLNVIYNRSNPVLRPIFCDYTNPFVILTGCCMILLFSNTNITSPLINHISKLTYGAYLIHVFFIVILQNFIPHNLVPFCNLKSSYFPFFDILYSVTVAVCSLLTEHLRIFIFEKLNLKQAKLP